MMFFILILFLLLPAVGLLEAVSSDEPLVRDFLLHFFVKADSFKPYQVYITGQ